MKVLTGLLLSLSLPVSHTALPPRTPVETAVVKRVQHRGIWYFAENGHAVFCYGPVLLVPDNQGVLQRMATVCRGGQTMVPLKD
jgi:hypothetical protein